jgi:hypothetical protein
VPAPRAGDVLRSAYEREGCGACDVCLGETVQGRGHRRSGGEDPGAVAELRGASAPRTWPTCWPAPGPAASASSATTSSPPTAACAARRRRACAAGSTSSWRTACSGAHRRRVPTVTLTEQGRAVLRGRRRGAGAHERGGGAGHRGRCRRRRRAEADGGARSAIPAPTIACCSRRCGAAADDREERGVPPYLVFSDASLRDMARLKPARARRCWRSRASALEERDLRRALPGADPPAGLVSRPRSGAARSSAST